ncbi:hypothetical protein PHLCEN_2v7415 [Hermanssonia centrifuga]|uniref:Uncharacterized protein n=1 Tax=Hermanssonia centrifuga TaxID=98765 RepID=A0A2R6NX65_9APHY|nr:hypothetical protein PHLCEN_2v7415 [Hermanssonia centrifuga]
MSTIRVALFVCDVPLAAVVEKDGDYPVIFNELLRQSLSLADSSASFILDSYDVREKMEYPKDIDEYQGIIMTGSAASAYENLEWINQLVAYIASLAEEKPHIKLIGTSTSPSHQPICATNPIYFSRDMFWTSNPWSRPRQRLRTKRR